MVPKVCVVGAGIMGLSTALQIAETIPGVEVTILAEDYPPNISSSAAGGYIVMAYFMKEDIPKDYEANSARKKATFDHCQRLFFSKEVAETGVQLVNLYRIAKTEEKEEDKPVDCDNYLGFRPMTQNEMKMFPAHRRGYSYRTYVINQSIYLPWLMKKVRELGVRMVKRKLKYLGEVANDFDIIVNCSGAAARDLVNDNEITMIRGHNLKVKAPWLKIALFDENTHLIVLPINDHVILGTTWHPNDLDPEPRLADRKHILNICSSVFPAMKDVEVVGEMVGWRPVRASLERVEKEEMENGGKRFTVVHNYGHGKEGITLHWGSAIDAANLVRESLQTMKPTLAKL
ncbi:D-aspartate oxidase-like isoform X2 [Lineus longissimus]